MMPSHIFGQKRFGRSGGVLGWFVLILLVAALIGGVMLREDVKTEAKENLHLAMAEPDTMLHRFFVARSLRYDPGDDRWPKLLEFMSNEDLDWFDRNVKWLAAWVAERHRVEVPDELQRRRYLALEGLLEFGLGATRLEQSRIQIAEYRGVAYMHEPKRLETLREIFLVKEEGSWKIRRFLGRRDRPELMRFLIDRKTKAGVTLEADEAAFAADADAYAKKKRTEMLAEAGLETVK